MRLSSSGTSTFHSYVSQFISWLNLDLGIEVCFFDGLDGYWKTWLQFAFPGYLFVLMAAIIIGCHYSVRLSRLCGSHAVPALATLFLMSYTKVLQTITNALLMSQLVCDNGTVLRVWTVDGNIAYVKHTFHCSSSHAEFYCWEWFILFWYCLLLCWKDSEISAFQHGATPWQD